jgi:hypothetical protein
MKLTITKLNIGKADTVTRFYFEPSDVSVDAFNDVVIEADGRPGQYGRRGKSRFYKLVIDREMLRDLLKAVDDQDPENLIATAVRSQSGLEMYQWGVMTPIQWFAGRAVTGFDPDLAQQSGLSLTD